MKLEINKTIYDNQAPYESIENAGTDYKLLNQYLMELGYGSFNCNDLYEFWSNVSDNYSASWLHVPETLDEFKHIIGYNEEGL